MRQSATSAARIFDVTAISLCSREFELIARPRARRTCAIDAHVLLGACVTSGDCPSAGPKARNERRFPLVRTEEVLGGWRSATAAGTDERW